MKTYFTVKLTVSKIIIAIFLLIITCDLNAQSISTLFKADFTGIAPAQNQPWIATSQSDPHINYSGLTIGSTASTFQGWETDNEFQIKSSYGTKSTLSNALANNDYVSFTITPTEGNTICLNNALLRFKSNFSGYDLGTQTYIFTSIGGFSEGEHIFVSEKINAWFTNVSTTNCYFPETGYDNINEPVEIRIYYADAFWNNYTSITELLMTGTFDGTTPALPVYSASGVEGSNFAEFAFDGIYKQWQSDAKTGWLQVLLSEPTIYNSYDLYTPLENLNNTPKNWTIQGSNNGTDWTILDTQTEQTPTEVSTKTDYKSVRYRFANNMPYSYYRMVITENNGGWQVYVSDIEYSFENGVISTIEKAITESDILIYPTKVINELTIKVSPEFEGANISVYNLQGNTIINNNIGNNQVTTLNFSNMDKGIYILHFTQGEKVYSKKIIKE